MKNAMSTSGRSAVSAAVSATAKPVEKRDKGRDAVRGLILRVQPRPSKVRAYYLQIARGKRIHIGDANLMTLAQARTAARLRLGEQAGGVDLVAEARQARLTLGKYIDGDWWEYAEANIASAATMKGCVKHSFAELLNKPMGEISEPDLAHWRKTRNERWNKDGTPRRPVSVESMRRELGYLRAIVNRAVASGMIAGHEIGRYRVAATLQDRHSTSKVRYLSPAEEKLLRAALDKRDRRMREGRARTNATRARRGQELRAAIDQQTYADHLTPLVLLALNTGLRRGDLFDLKWSEVDLERRYIRRVIGKASHARRKRGKPVEPHTLPLSTEAQTVLQHLKEERDPDSDLVLPSPRSGTRLDNTKKGFAKVLDDAGITHFTFHDLRHSFASKLVMAGVDLNTVRELLTHSDIRMTLIYAHLSPDHKAAALDRAFGAAP
jgi:integrase